MTTLLDRMKQFAEMENAARVARDGPTNFGKGSAPNDPLTNLPYGSQMRKLYFAMPKEWTPSGILQKITGDEVNVTDNLNKLKRRGLAVRSAERVQYDPNDTRKVAYLWRPVTPEELEKKNDA